MYWKIASGHLKGWYYAQEEENSKSALVVAVPANYPHSLKELTKKLGPETPEFGKYRGKILRTLSKTPQEERKKILRDLVAKA